MTMTSESDGDQHCPWIHHKKTWLLFKMLEAFLRSPKKYIATRFIKETLWNGFPFEKAKHPYGYALCCNSLKHLIISMLTLIIRYCISHIFQVVHAEHQQRIATSSILFRKKIQ